MGGGAAAAGGASPVTNGVPFDAGIDVLSGCCVVFIGIPGAGDAQRGDGMGVWWTEEVIVDGYFGRRGAPGVLVLGRDGGRRANGEVEGLRGTG